MARAQRASGSGSGTPARGAASGSRTPRSRARTTAASRRAAPRFGVSPGTVRSLIGILLIVLGAITLIALFLPGTGILTNLVSQFLKPTFGQGAWLLAVLLLLAGVLVERAPKVGNGWGVAAIGGLTLFLGGEGLIDWFAGSPKVAARGGGTIGHVLNVGLADLVSSPGALVVLVGISVAGVLLLFNLTLRQFFRPVQVGGRAVASAASATVAAARPRWQGDVAAPVGIAPALDPPAARAGRSRGAVVPERAVDVPPELPRPLSSPAPMSQTVWAGAASTGGRLIPVPTAPPSGAASSGSPTVTDEADGTAGTSGAPPISRPRFWSLPAVALLEETTARVGGAVLDHERNRQIIAAKLNSFQIAATVVGHNPGPVVTQYEVKPEAHVKLSRIEALADDLAMALAARSIRIEAPIPGRDVVGIEIPNHTSEVVSFRQLYEDAQMSEATGKLTFALGRDVSGKAYAVDLARMPHLLIAGATGSGKSVCVNALITSLLMRARPDEVQLILIDLKRVELAQYADLPHLKTPVIVEANDARKALGWAVREMEERYKKLASRSERNITAYNSSPRVAVAERLPYIVVVIDELADLMMREGRKVEDPVVKLAQKARAVGIHLVLATQRPSVNVVTGLIKANVPSRIAFAMSSNVDSRTVLDQPGAEDLIGRGDMLYQPADLPRPVRLQGVFVSDAEVRAITDFWREQQPEPEYDPDVLSGLDDDGGEGGEFGWLAQMAEDELTARAAELVMLTGKASTSMMQTKLKVGFNRASRLMDELERYGIVGPQDPRNPAVPRQVYGPDNWVRAKSDMDDL